METAQLATNQEIVLKGALTIQRISEVKEELMEAMNQVDNLMINLSEATELDLSCLQLICSGHRTAIRLNKSLSLINKAASVATRFGDAGFTVKEECPCFCGETCVWSSSEE